MLNLLQNQFIGVYELRKTLPKVLSFLKKENEAVVVTRQGKPAAVMMDIEYYLELQEALGDLTEPGYTDQLNEAVEDVKKRKGVPAQKLYKQLDYPRRLLQIKGDWFSVKEFKETRTKVEKRLRSLGL